MKFRKSGKDIIKSIQFSIQRKNDLLKKENEIFEKEKDKRALQAVHELQIAIRRLESLLPHIEEGQEYWITEEDLQDFGFFYKS